jgi:hypothetical protein
MAIRSGPASYGAFAPSRDLTPESLRGSPCGDLTLGIARGVCTTPVGFHRFEPVDEWNHSHSGQILYPTRNFARYSPPGFPGGRTLSWAAAVCDSTLDVKSLRVPCCGRAFPADCPHVRLILTARWGASEYRTAVRGVSRIWSSFTKASDWLTLGPL